MKHLLPLLLFIAFTTQAQIQLGGDIDGDSSNDDAGTVAISSDGSVLAIGAVGYNSFRGQVRFFRYSSGSFGSSWIQEGNHILGEATGDFSGRQIALSSNGQIIAIGASANDGNGSFSGHVRIYENVSGTWTQIGNDIDGEAADDFSGDALSLSADGNIIAIGAISNDDNGSTSGHVRLYQNIAGTWTQIGSDIDGEAADDFFGQSVALSSDASTLAIGTGANDGNGNRSGHVRVYDLRNILSVNEFDASNVNIYPNPFEKEITINGLKSKITGIEIFTIDGKQINVVDKPFNNNIDVNTLTKGIYLLKVKTIDGYLVKKIIKK